MKITLFGVNGFIGQRILDEALNRGHAVNVVVRDRSKFAKANDNLSVVTGDVTDATSVAAASEGSDAIISAVGPTNSSPQVVVDAARSLLEGAVTAGLKKLVIVGGAGSLEVAPNVQLVDTPEFPAAWKDIALAHRDSLEIYRKTPTDVEWTYVSPAAFIEPGERTGKFRIGGDQLLVDEKGESRISAEDYAVALLDEIEKPQHPRQRITVAY